jgi:hypothetical protein
MLVKPGDGRVQGPCFRAPTLFLCFLCTIWQASKEYIGLVDGFPFLDTVVRTLLHAGGIGSYSQEMRAAALVAIAACRDEQSFHDHISKRELRELSFAVVADGHDLNAACRLAFHSTTHY